MTDDLRERVADIIESAVDEGCPDIAVDCGKWADDLLAAIEPLMLERAALEQVGWTCSHCGPHPKSSPSWCELGCGSDYNRMTPVYRLRGKS